MTFNRRKEEYEYLKKNPEQPFEAKEIANYIFENFFDDYCEGRRAEFPGASDSEFRKGLLKKMPGETGSWILQPHRRGKEYTGLKVIEGSPKKVYWTNKTDEDEVKEAEKSSLNEKDLYPIISEYLWFWSRKRIYSKRIDEKTSSNKKGPKGNQWLYPDLVGMEDLAADWDDKIKKVVKEYGDRKIRLWSFEVKQHLNMSNLRESFFQAVSNSSWANFGYLAAKTIEGDETMKELRILSSLHGIGLIRIDPENPSESQILIPARERPEIDWSACNRIAGENTDFLDFVDQVWDFHRIGKINLEKWDIPADEG